MHDYSLPRRSWHTHHSRYREDLTLRTLGLQGLGTDDFRNTDFWANTDRIHNTRLSNTDERNLLLAICCRICGCFSQNSVDQFCCFIFWWAYNKVPFYAFCSISKPSFLQAMTTTITTANLNWLLVLNLNLCWIDIVIHYTWKGKEQSSFKEKKYFFAWAQPIRIRAHIRGPTYSNCESEYGKLWVYFTR